MPNWVFSDIIFYDTDESIVNKMNVALSAISIMDTLDNYGSFGRLTPWLGAICKYLPEDAVDEYTNLRGRISIGEIFPYEYDDTVYYCYSVELMTAWSESADPLIELSKIISPTINYALLSEYEDDGLDYDCMIDDINVFQYLDYLHDGETT